MAAGRQKQFMRPPAKKKPPKAAALETVDDYQEAADFEESAGGKHRAGDAIKSGRAFVRALDVYDQGLRRHPNSFDLAYNKARLQLEISQQPNLVEHIGLPLIEWLQRTLHAHRYALRLSEDNPNILFNAAQVLVSLAEQLSEADRTAEAVPLLQEALELLSSCLSRQEMMFEQHQLDFPDAEDGGVALEVSEQPAQTPSDTEMQDEQSASVETPVTADDLLDTVHASLSALTTLVSLTEETTLNNLGSMAHSLTETKAPDYIRMLPLDEQDKARSTVVLDKAIFVAALANAQFEAQIIEFQTYIQRLDTFHVATHRDDLATLSAEAEARTELVLSALDRYGETLDLPATICWKQLTVSQDIYNNAIKLNAQDSQERRPELLKSRGDLELLRHRIATIPKANLSDNVRKSAQTLLQNAQTYYKGAVSYARASGDVEVEVEAQVRLDLAKQIAARLYGGATVEVDHEGLVRALERCVDEGLLSLHLAQAVMEGSHAVAGSS